MIAAILYIVGILVALLMVEFRRRRKTDAWLRVVPQQMAAGIQEAPRKERELEERPSRMPTADVAGPSPTPRIASPQDRAA